MLPFEVHPETPLDGAPKPFSPRLQELAREVGLPIDPPTRNVNSRFALETAELVRAKLGDAASGAFHRDVSRAFFTQGVRGVPAMAWPNQRAVVGMMRPEELVERLRSSRPKVSPIP